MSGFQWKAINTVGAIVGVALMLQDLAIAQSQTTTTQIDKPNRVSVAYGATKDLVLRGPEILRQLPQCAICD